MNEKQKERDTSIVHAIAGDLPGNTGIWIEDGYFARERDENLASQGYPVPVKERYYSETERRMKKDNRMMEELEEERTNKLASPFKNRREEGGVEKGWPQREGYGDPSDRKVRIVTVI